MNEPASRPLRDQIPTLAALVAVPFAALLWSYWPTLVELSQVWQRNAQYSHGYLVPGFAILLLWLRRDRLQLDNLRPNLVLGLTLLSAGIGLRLFGSSYYYVWLEPISIVPCVAGLVLLHGGLGACRWAWPSVLFLSFMVPLPYRVDTALAGPLQRLATVVSTFLMQVIGLPALSEGNTILLNDHQLGIVEACSGLRMLVVFFALSTAVIMVIDRPWLDKLIVLASSIPIALFCNIIRILVTGILYETTSSEWAHTFFHDAAGWMMMLLALAILGIELKLLSALFVSIPGGTMAVSRPISLPTARKALPTRTQRAPRTMARPISRTPKKKAESPIPQPAAEFGDAS